MRHRLKKKKPLESLERAQAFKVSGPSIRIQDPIPKLSKSQFKSTPSLQPLAEIQFGTRSNEGQEVEISPAKSNKNLPALDRKSLLDTKEIYLQHFKETKINGVSAWTFAGEEEIEENMVALVFESELAQEEFDREKKEILAFYEERFSDVPQFETSVSADVVSDKIPRTNQQKFEYLSKKYPKLRDLQNLLKLTFD